MTVAYADREIGTYKLYRATLKYRYGQNQSGYGSKIATDIMLQFDNEKRRRRVYCVCYSNCGSLYVIVRGERYFLGTVFQEDVIDE